MPLCLVPVKNGRTVALDKTIVFGRHPECDVVLTRSRKVSRKHCCIAQVNDKYVVRDLGSLNGVKVNGKLVRRARTLKVGDELLVGDCLYTVTIDADAKSGKSRSSRKKKKSAEVPSIPEQISEADVILLDEDDEA